MRLAIAIGLALALAGCGDDAPKQRPAREGVTAWESQASAAGVALIMRAPDGGELMRLACVRDPATLSVDVSRFTDLGGAQALSVSIGNGPPFVFATSLERDQADGGGVHGEGPVPPELFDRLGRADRISASYGAQYFGPYPPPERARIMEFTNACREVVER